MTYVVTLKCCPNVDMLAILGGQETLCSCGVVLSIFLQPDIIDDSRGVGRGLPDFGINTPNSRLGTPLHIIPLHFI